MNPDCAHCRFFDSPKEHNHPLLTNRPGGLEGTKRALAYCSLPAQAKVVDIACGKGATIQLLRETYGYRAIGIDISGRMLKEAGNYVQIHRIKGALHGYFALGIKHLYVQESFTYINAFLKGEAL